MRIGYACCNLTLAARGVKSTRTVVLAKATPAKLRELALQNLADLAVILRWNEANGIRFFRITSNLFPHMENPKLAAVTAYTIDFARKELAEIGAYARGAGHRLTMHPGQYTQLGSNKPGVIAQSKRDLILAASIFEAMGLTPQLGTCLVIHGGGKYGDPAAALARWAKSYGELPPYTRSLVVLENDEHWSIEELLPLCEEYKVPLVVDFFHHTLRPGSADIATLLPRVLRIWRLRGMPPKCHLSGQAPGKRRGAHADCVAEIPLWIRQWCEAESVDLCLEVKNKEQCLLALRA
jgi:UV DNA damage endonuclease